MGRFDFNDDNNFEGIKELKKIYDDLMENMLSNGYSEDLFNDSTKLKEMLKQFDSDAVKAMESLVLLLDDIKARKIIRSYIQEWEYVSFLYYELRCIKWNRK